MKKTLIISLVVATLAISNTYGQTKFGVKGGLNFASASIEGADGLDTKSKTGFHGGIFLAFKLNKIAIQPEALWSVQGVTTSFDDFGVPVELDTDLNYVNIPIMVKIYLIKGLHLELGPTFGLLISAETAGIDVKEELKSSDISASFGVGYDAIMGLGGGIRYNLGVSDILEDPASGESWKNNNLMVSVWYAIKK